ncbi:MAG TPA: hypothetical protein VLB47_13875, partial [Solirubrobacteraceae bacterium]|nr:hypothetical protein [Solirubrobacteraceae bacterium]
DLTPTTVACALDEAPFGPCTSPGGHVLRGLAAGRHTLSVRAVDAVGSTATLSTDFIVDTADLAGPPRLTVAVRRARRVERRWRAPVLAVTSDEPATLTVRVARGRRTLRTRTIGLAAGRRATLRLTVPRRAFGRARRLAVEVRLRAADRDGDVATATRKVTLRR